MFGFLRRTAPYDFIDGLRPSTVGDVLYQTFSLTSIDTCAEHPRRFLSVTTCAAGSGDVPPCGTGLNRHALLPQGALPCQGRGAHSFLEKNPPHTPEEKHQGVSIRPGPPTTQRGGLRPSPLDSPPKGRPGASAPAFGIQPPGVWTGERYLGPPLRTAIQARNPPTGCADRCSPQNCIPASESWAFIGLQDRT